MSEYLRPKESQIDYERLLSVRKVDTDQTRNIPWKLAVSENFTLYITGQTHAHLYEAYGVDPDMTLQEGYIYFDKQGNVKEVKFKLPYQPVPGFRGSESELLKLREAIRSLVYKNLS